MSDVRQLRKLWREHKKQAKINASQPDVKIGLSASFTVDPLVPYLGTYLLEHGYNAPEIELADYSQIMQTCYGWKNHFSEDTNAIFLCWQIEEMIGDKVNTADTQELLAATDEMIAELIGGIRDLREEFDGLIVVGIPPIPHYIPQDIAYFGQIPVADIMWMRMMDAMQSDLGGLKNLSFLNFDKILRDLGTQTARDERKRLLYRQPFNEIVYLHLGKELARFVRTQRMEAKKCIVLDCDNTVWGGIIGEDGMGGIKLGKDFPGRAFTEFQHMCKVLKESGVLLAICSKNNYDDAYSVFTDHDEMIIRPQDVAVFKINWDLKSENIKAIADELNIGTSSLVFVDDSDYEVSEVNNVLPEVTTVHVPKELADFPEFFRSFLPLFDRLEITDDDKQRAERMRQEVGRKSASKALSREDFLKSLQLKLDYFKPTEDDLERTTQLVNKTNQFNLTTTRLDFATVKSYNDRDDRMVRCIRVEDKFGGYGLVGVAFVEIDGETAFIRNFLMSCRVLGRGIETGFISNLLQELESKGVKKVFAAYLPSPKNQQVEPLYKNHNFGGPVDGLDYQYDRDGAVYWEISPKDRIPTSEHLDVRVSI